MVSFNLPIYAGKLWFNNFSFINVCLSDAGDSEDDKSSVDNKKRRKNKVHEIKEESQITNDFAQQLDLSCMSKGLVKAPSINNGYIAKYNRWVNEWTKVEKKIQLLISTFFCAHKRKILEREKSRKKIKSETG